MNQYFATITVNLTLYHEIFGTRGRLVIGNATLNADRCRVENEIPKRRRHRPGLLPAFRPQRNGRAHVHATSHVSAHQKTLERLQAIYGQIESEGNSSV